MGIDRAGGRGVDVREGGSRLAEVVSNVSRKDFDPMRASYLALALPLLVTAVGCAPAESSDDVGGGSSAASAVENDFLTKCPSFEGTSATAMITGDNDLVVRQAYRVSGYTGFDGRVVPASNVETFGKPSSVYDVRFYRDNAGKTKFQLTIGTFAGMQAAIEGSTKRISVSGTVDLAEDGTRGTLTISSRRDALRTIAGDISTFAFDHLECGDAPSISIVAPVITLDKASEETVDVPSPAVGVTVPVTKSIRWKKKADAVPLRFEWIAG